MYLQRLDEELTVATEAFFESESCTLDLARREVPIQHYVLIIVRFRVTSIYEPVLLLPQLHLTITVVCAMCNVDQPFHDIEVVQRRLWSQQP